MIQIKKGVRLTGVGTEMTFGLYVVASVFDSMGVDCVVTSCIEGTHTRASEHYQGNALDFRIWVLQQDQWQELETRCRVALGDDFSVILESDHLHVSWKPKVAVAP